MSFLGIFISILIFSVIILLHEWGHYASSRLFGVKVEEFGLGIPPRAKKLWQNKAGTLFSLNWLPLGGFVKISGENELFLQYYDENKNILPEKKLKEYLQEKKDFFSKKGQKIAKSEKKYLENLLLDTPKNQRFSSKNIFQKTFILSAGVLMNFFTAFVIFFILFQIGIQPLGINTIIPSNTSSMILPSYEDALSQGILIKKEGILLYPVENSLAETSGLQQGDILTKIQNETVFDIETVQKIIGESAGKILIFQILRENESLEIPVNIGEDGKIGSYLSENISYNENFTYQFGFFDASKYALHETYAQIKLTFLGTKMLAQKIFFPINTNERKEALEEVSGPIGIVQVVNQSLGQGIIFLSIFAALISINLGVLNILPIPALDGGRILLLWIRSTIEFLFGKKQKFIFIENFTHIFFFVLIIALSFIIAYNDINKIISPN